MEITVEDIVTASDKHNRLKNEIAAVVGIVKFPKAEFRIDSVDNSGFDHGLLYTWVVYRHLGKMHARLALTTNTHTHMIWDEKYGSPSVKEVERVYWKLPLLISGYIQEVPTAEADLQDFVGILHK